MQNSASIEIREDDLNGPEIADLLAEHLEHMYEISPPESVHAFDVNKLRAPNVTFWTAWADGELVGCGALKALDETSAEIKSMRTANRHRRKGVAKRILEHIIRHARNQGFAVLYLETGPRETFGPAHALYAQFGFRYRGPFGDYGDDPHSRFMALSIE